MTSQLYIFFLIALVLFGCSKENTTTPEESSDKISSIEYAVLRTLIDSMYYSSTDSKLVLRDSTTSGLDFYNLDSALTFTLQNVQEHFNILNVETMQDFKSKNLTKTNIQNPSNVHPSCVFPGQSDKIGTPLIEVSRVGFSSDCKQAIAYIGRMDAPLNGHGYYHILSQEQGKWIIIGRIMIWIS
jgi:hypothetical protein